MVKLPAYAEARAQDIESNLLLFGLEFTEDPQITVVEDGDFRINYRAEFPGTTVAIEMLEVVGDLPDDDKRVKYSYHVWNQETDCDLWRWDRDPDNHPEMPDHEHKDGNPEGRYPMTVTCLQAVHRAWRLVYRKPDRPSVPDQ